ncbi:hypothetical protein NIES4071_104620 (plasmid) [Calothrix sp. NIES-4071]|nr:hypothetical protein NIES4071_104620 [Calothrix sp. NIES-4071]BAZ64880.1 hypothetical protein NIES4105_106130 [Calothrix sp. NIES-4105]
MKTEEYQIVQNTQGNVQQDNVSTLLQQGGSTVAVILAMSMFMLAITRYSKTLLKTTNKK